jgi:hypothetical protein
MVCKVRGQHQVDHQVPEVLQLRVILLLKEHAAVLAHELKRQGRMKILQYRPGMQQAGVRVCGNERGMNTAGKRHGWPRHHPHSVAAVSHNRRMGAAGWRALQCARPPCTYASLYVMASLCWVSTINALFTPG